LFTYKFLINFISKFNSFSLFFIEIFLIRPKKKTMKNIGHRQHRIQPIDHIESTRPNISRCCLFSPLSDEFFYYPLSWLMLIASHRACQKSVLTTKKTAWGDPAVRSTRLLQDLLQLWLRTNSPLDHGVRESRCVSHFSLQNDKDMETFRYIDSPPQRGQ
jgi:hypothetical protein